MLSNEHYRLALCGKCWPCPFPSSAGPPLRWGTFVLQCPPCPLTPKSSKRLRRGQGNKDRLAFIPHSDIRNPQSAGPVARGVAVAAGDDAVADNVHGEVAIGRVGVGGVRAASSVGDAGETAGCQQLWLTSSNIDCYDLNNNIGRRRCGQSGCATPVGRWPGSCLKSKPSIKKRAFCSCSTSGYTF